MLGHILQKPTTQETLVSLADFEVLKMVIAPARLIADEIETIFAPNPDLALMSGAKKCLEKEVTMHSFSCCPLCKTTFYCGRACQKSH